MTDWIEGCLTGVLATTAIVTAWSNRPSREPDRHVRVCSRGYPIAEPPETVRLVERPRVFDQDVD